MEKDLFVYMLKFEHLFFWQSWSFVKHVLLCAIAIFVQMERTFPYVVIGRQPIFYHLWKRIIIPSHLPATTVSWLCVLVKTPFRRTMSEKSVLLLGVCSGIFYAISYRAVSGHLPPILLPARIYAVGSVLAILSLGGWFLFGGLLPMLFSKPSERKGWWIYQVAFAGIAALMLGGIVLSFHVPLAVLHFIKYMTL